METLTRTATPAPTTQRRRKLVRPDPSVWRKEVAVDKTNHEIPQEPVEKTEEIAPKPNEKICKFWAVGNCVKGDRCSYLHSWSQGDGFSMLAKLQGQKKPIIGISTLLGDKLYTGSKDGTVRVWDCHSGECDRVINLGAEVGSLISEGHWVFAGLPNVVKAWNIENGAEYNLNGPVGQANTMVTSKDILFAGTQSGQILAWRGSCDQTNPFPEPVSLEGHKSTVICLAIGRDSRLYSGSMDHTIRVWNTDTLQCVATLEGHSDSVMSLICWDQFLLSASLDGTLKFWSNNAQGNLEVAYTHKEEHGILAINGMKDNDAKPILFCSCNDNIVRLYELPSFLERGRLFAKREVRVIQDGPGGLFFTGDETGLLTAWKMAT
ncbi:hypothetical protein UlMin_028645 [Ulmus minor]